MAVGGPAATVVSPTLKCLITSQDVGDSNTARFLVHCNQLPSATLQYDSPSSQSPPGFSSRVTVTSSGLLQQGQNTSKCFQFRSSELELLAHSLYFVSGEETHT